MTLFLQGGGISRPSSINTNVMATSAFSIVGGGGAGASGNASYLGNLQIYNDITTDQTLDLSVAAGMIVYNIENSILLTLSTPATGKMYTILFQKDPDASGTPTISVSANPFSTTQLYWVGNQIGTLTNPIIMSVACFENTDKLFVAMAQQQ